MVGYRRIISRPAAQNHPPRPRLLPSLSSPPGNFKNQECPPPSNAGLNFEKLHGMIEPTTGQQLYSLRVTGSVRAITCLVNGPTIVLVSLHTQHDTAYRK